jgi:dTDP-4-dehydrorhamnose reductase
VLLFGAGGYMGKALADELDRRVEAWEPGDWMSTRIRSGHRLVINAAAYIPKPSVIACDQQPDATIRGNLMLPTRLAQACFVMGIPFAHLSTGCLWTDGAEHDEASPPQRGFGGHCGFYVGTKVLAEDAVRAACPQHYIWRVRLPFDEVANPRNYLSKLAAFHEVWDQVNSASHRADFAKAALDLWKARAPWGTYHLVNPGALSARTIVDRMAEHSILDHVPVIIPRGDGACRLSVKKALACGITIRSADEALEDALRNWKP